MSDKWEWKLTIEPGQKKYNPDQPREPAGGPGGGQWTSGGGVDLSTAEGRGQATTSRLQSVIPSSHKPRKFTWSREAEDFIKEHFRARDMARGKGGQRLVVKKKLVDLLPNGDNLYEHTHGGESIYSVKGAYDITVYAP